MEVAFPVLRPDLELIVDTGLIETGSIIRAATAAGLLVRDSANEPAMEGPIKWLKITSRATSPSDSSPILALSVLEFDAFDVIDGPFGPIWLKPGIAEDEFLLEIDGHSEGIPIALPFDRPGVLEARSHIAMLSDLRTIMVLVLDADGKGGAWTMFLDIASVRESPPTVEAWAHKTTTLHANETLALIGFGPDRFIAVDNTGSAFSFKVEDSEPGLQQGIRWAISLGPARSAVVRDVSSEASEVAFSDGPAVQVPLSAEGIATAFGYLGSVMLRTEAGLVHCSPERCAFLVCVSDLDTLELCDNARGLKPSDMTMPSPGPSPKSTYLPVGSFLIPDPSRQLAPGDTIHQVLAPGSFGDLKTGCHH